MWVCFGKYEKIDLETKHTSLKVLVFTETRWNWITSFKKKRLGGPILIIKLSKTPSWGRFELQDILEKSISLLRAGRGDSMTIFVVSTLPETNIAPENRSSHKETSIPTIHFQVLC